MRKADRHLLIRQIITEHTVRTQEELLQQLEAQGVSATQATISRDIRDLIQMIEDVVTKVDRVQFMTLIHTVADNAPLLSAAIDEVTMPEKVCSLAGFDTVAVISRSDEDAETFYQFIRNHAVL